MNATLTDGGNGDLLVGSAHGNDTFSALQGRETVDGGGGTAAITAGFAPDVINAGSGATSVTGGVGVDTINGGSGSLFVLTTGDLIKAGSGATSVLGAIGSGLENTIKGGSGTLSINAANQSMIATGGQRRAQLHLRQPRQRNHRRQGRCDLQLGQWNGWRFGRHRRLQTGHRQDRPHKLHEVRFDDDGESRIDAVQLQRRDQDRSPRCHQCQTFDRLRLAHSTVVARRAFQHVWPPLQTTRPTILRGSMVRIAQSMRAAIWLGSAVMWAPFRMGLSPQHSSALH